LEDRKARRLVNANRWCGVNWSNQNNHSTWLSELDIGFKDHPTIQKFKTSNGNCILTTQQMGPNHRQRVLEQVPEQVLGWSG